MGWLTTLFYLTTLFTGVPAFWQLGFGLGMCGTFAPLIGHIAGGGAVSAFRDKETTAWGTLVVAIVMIALSLLWISETGWHVFIFHHDIPGTLEVSIGIVIGGLFGFSRTLNPPDLQ